MITNNGLAYKLTSPLLHYAAAFPVKLILLYFYCKGLFDKSLIVNVNHDMQKTNE